MTKSTHNQQSYTEGILAAAGRSSSEYPLYIKIWWWNHTNSNSLRLSADGIKFVKKQTKIPIYQIEVSHPLSSKHLVYLTRTNIGPFYLQHTNKKCTIFLLDKEVATMLTLHAGNLDQYLENLQL